LNMMELVEAQALIDRLALPAKRRRIQMNGQSEGPSTTILVTVEAYDVILSRLRDEGHVLSMTGKTATEKEPEAWCVLNAPQGWYVLYGTVMDI
jgi:hypothetical protein